MDGWTGGQPFLTQKVCQLVVQSIRLDEGENYTPSPIVDRLIHLHIIDNWEAQDEPEHLKTIRDRLLYNEQRAGRLLGLYQQILLSSPDGTSEKGIPANNNSYDINYRTAVRIKIWTDACGILVTWRISSS